MTDAQLLALLVTVTKASGEIPDWRQLARNILEARRVMAQAEREHHQ